MNQDQSTHQDHNVDWECSTYIHGKLSNEIYWCNDGKKFTLACTKDSREQDGTFSFYDLTIHTWVIYELNQNAQSYVVLFNSVFCYKDMTSTWLLNSIPSANDVVSEIQVWFNTSKLYALWISNWNYLILEQATSVR